MAHRSDEEIIQATHNAARYFTENRHISWVLLIGVLLWGVYGYMHLPKRKDPEVPARVAVAITPWPGMSAEKIEQLVTRQIEATIAENQHLHKPDPGGAYGIISTTLPGVSIVHVQLDEDLVDTEQVFSDINLKLNSINKNLPQGAGPIQFNSGFGDTAALMLTVASPKESDVEIALRARTIAQAIKHVRSQAPSGQADSRVTLVVAFPRSISPQIPQRRRDLLARYMTEEGLARDLRPLQGPGFVGLDAVVDADDATILAAVQTLIQKRLGTSGFFLDGWPPVLIRHPQDTEMKLATVAGDKYSYRELDDVTELIQRNLQTLPLVSQVARFGVLTQRVFLDYSQERLASYGIQPSHLKQVLGARNIALPGGVLQIKDTSLIIDPSGEFKSAREIGDVIITFSSTGAPVYLRDLVAIARDYQSPPTYLNFYTWRDAKGVWQRGRAITLAVQMRSGEQINAFGTAIDALLPTLKQVLPDDLIVVRTSDQPRQVRENIDLFMTALYEAIILVVLVALVGFREWRSALLMAISIPLTLAMTFGMIDLLGINLQQISIATLIVALGLLVDDPVVAGDAIKRELAAGHAALVAAWLGPTKLARAILFATVTNIVAYLPFLLMTGTTGQFLYSLPIVMMCALVASRLVSMTFVPLLGYYLLRPRSTPELSIEERRQRGFTGAYFKLGTFAIKHRWLAFALSLVCFGLGVHFMGQLKIAFFPDDVEYLSTVDVWLPNNATLSATNRAAIRVEQVIRRVGEEYGKKNPDRDGKPRRILKSVTTFVGGGGPRFWQTLIPQDRQLNYAQVIIEVTDKDDTPRLEGQLQRALSSAVPGGRIDVRQLQLNPVPHPVEVHISGRAEISPQQEQEQIRTLRALAEQVKDIFRSIPEAARFRDDWGEESFVVKLQVDPDRANLAGVTNLDVANSSTAGISGKQVATLREGNKQIPVLTRLRLEERAQLSDIQNLYVYSSENTNKIPLLEVSSIQANMETERIHRREHFRTITVWGFPIPGALPSQVTGPARPRLLEFAKALPPGYTMVIGGEKAKQMRGFKNMAMVMAISMSAIFLALVFQFNNAVKPLLVFAAVPYGAVGALMGLVVMGAPFSMMAFLGIASLVGVIISHVIVLFDFIEKMHEKGEPLHESLLDAGIVRLRPIMITVGATIFALFPLAIHGGPLWQPLCYAQIGGLLLATFLELLLVPVLYAIFVLDLKIVTWGTIGVHNHTTAAASVPSPTSKA